jgi:hypothetical protein
MNGSARGTALVMLMVAVPLVAMSMALSSRGSARAALTMLGGLVFLIYNSVLLIFNGPFNGLFLVYVAALSLSVWSLVAALSAIDVRALRDRFDSRLPVRAVVAYSLAVVTLNFLGWMAEALPAVLSTKTPSFLMGTGVTTNPVFVLDLGFTLPIMALGAVWLWQRRAWGYLIIGAMLTMFVVESFSVATDQWMGHGADPASPVASATLTPIFAVIAGIGMIVLIAFLRHADSSTTAGSAWPESLSVQRDLAGTAVPIK